MSNYAVFFKGGVGRESVFMLNTCILYTTPNFPSRGLDIFIPKYSLPSK